tara:strand:+ start:10640 stop:11650 length:1011 start_codon:yes stop_codon:yes gene_type:complete
MRAEWDEAYKRLRAHYRSFWTAKISLKEHCFYDLIPENFLIHYMNIKSRITQHVLETYEKPQDYDFLLDLHMLCEQIKSQTLNIDYRKLNEYRAMGKNKTFFKVASKADPVAKYDIFGTKTGRMTTTKSSFPVLTFDRRFRDVLRPNNDWFLEIDYNSCELRVLMSLAGQKQPEGDIHEHTRKTLFKNKITRAETKEATFGWLYRSDKEKYKVRHDADFTKLFKTDKVRSDHWDGQTVRTVYNREIASDEDRCLNHIVQSTAADLCSRKVIELNEFLKDKKTHISFMNHDAVVLDFKEKDKKHLNEIVKLFQDTRFGKFRVNVSCGKNYKELKKIC